MRILPAALFAALTFSCGSVEPVPNPTPTGDPAPSTHAPGTSAPAPAATPTPPDSVPEPGGGAGSAPGQPTQPALTAAECFKDLQGAVKGPDYDQFKPTLAKSCAGTHHQTITGVEKVVFLGDSITVGTPPTMPDDFYRVRLEKALEKKFGTLEKSSCANWGAETNDLLANDKQLEKCFPKASEPKRTLVVMTVGGNDVHSWAKKKVSSAAALVEAQAAAANLRAAVDWLKSPGRFTNGVYVIFANVYEYTDTSGDLSSCPTATLAGMSGTWTEGTEAVVTLQEQFMKVAVETKTDMMFMLEHFCGHGWNSDDPTLQCYRGASAPRWIDATCIHPNPDGHDQIAAQFLKVVEGP
jgi:lysophospholipase L1-like esterase